MASRVLVTHALPGGTTPLEEAGHDIVRPGGDDPARDEILRLAGDVDAVVCPLTVEVDEELLAAGPRLRAVANVAVGYDNVDVDAATERGVLVCNTPGVLDETTADLAFALILAASRLMSDAERDLRAGGWEGLSLAGYLGRDVHGATLGLVGYGRIGRAVARRARGFDMTVLHHARTPTGETGYVADLDDLLRRAEIVSLHVPLTDETRGLIGARELELIGESGVLVNTARGPVVDEDALADALHAGTIFAAGLDVHEDEPNVHPRLLDAPRSVLLPHIGSASHETRARMAAVAQRAVITALSGDVPAVAVNPDAWEGARQDPSASDPGSPDPELADPGPAEAAGPHASIAVRIRTFTLDDLPAVRELWGAAEGMQPPPDEEVMRKLERDRELFLIAETTPGGPGAGRIVGVVMGTYDGRRGWIFRLAVDPEHRRTGLGRALIEELERRFAQRGIHHLRLLAFEDNVGAKRFWEELGYVGTEVVLYSKDLRGS